MTGITLLQDYSIIIQRMESKCVVSPTLLSIVLTIKECKFFVYLIGCGDEVRKNIHRHRKDNCAVILRRDVGQGLEISQL